MIFVLSIQTSSSVQWTHANGFQSAVFDLTNFKHFKIETITFIVDKFVKLYIVIFVLHSKRNCYIITSVLITMVTAAIPWTPFYFTCKDFLHKIGSSYNTLWDPYPSLIPVPGLIPFCIVILYSFYNEKDGFFLYNSFGLRIINVRRKWYLL